MLENQFIQLKRYIRPPMTQPALVLRFNRLTTLYFPSSGVANISLVDDSDDVVIGNSINPDTSVTYNFIHIFEQGEYLNQSSAIETNKTYFIRLTVSIGQGSIKLYSQPIIFVDDSIEMSYVQYKCDEDAFGFPFVSSNDPDHSLSTASVYMWLPIRLHSPQNVQDDKTYVKANGDVVTLYAKYYHEWEGETEYLSAEMHDKIVAALSCDVVYIDGKRVTKSDNYQVDWENYDLDCDGVTKLARATFKVRENTNQRNSNY